MLDSSIYIRQIPLYIRWIQTGYNHTARTTGCLGCTLYLTADICCHIRAKNIW